MSKCKIKLKKSRDTSQKINTCTKTIKNLLASKPITETFKITFKQTI